MDDGTLTSAPVMWWWSALCAVAAVNILAWSFSAAVFPSQRRKMPADLYSVRRMQLLLSAIYVFGCAYRSALPVYDLPRICLFNTWLSSVVVGRSVATIAELCFVAQWALMLHEVSQATGSSVAKFASRVMVPLIVIAECCSWYAVLTTSNLGHVAEESIWGLTVALLVSGIIPSIPLSGKAGRRALFAGCVVGVFYVGYMFSVDVPMYWSRWSADQLHGRHYLSAGQGLADVANRWVVSHRWEDWKTEMIWMGLYFSVAVWISISLVHAPPMVRRNATDEKTAA